MWGEQVGEGALGDLNSQVRCPSWHVIAMEFWKSCGARISGQAGEPAGLMTNE